MDDNNINPMNQFKERVLNKRKLANLIIEKERMEAEANKDGVNVTINPQYIDVSYQCRILQATLDANKKVLSKTYGMVGDIQYTTR